VVDVTLHMIWKFDLMLADYFIVTMPEGAEILTVAEQDGLPRVWARVDPAAPPIGREFKWIATGQAVDPDPPLTYIGTVVDVGGSGLVLHLHEMGEQRERAT
jgi:hypothetical protein